MTKTICQWGWGMEYGYLLWKKGETCFSSQAFFFLLYSIFTSLVAILRVEEVFFIVFFKLTIVVQVTDDHTD